jgi:1,4-dihydroxy-2-naphthoate octaprenyltransferase
MKNGKLLLEVLQPGAVFLTLAGFSVGTGVAHFFGYVIFWGYNLLVYFSLVFLVWAKNLFWEYFDHPDSSFSILAKSHPRYASLSGVKRPLLLTYGFLALTAATFFVTLVGFTRGPDPSLFLIIVLFAVLLLLTAIPPFFLQRKGFGELAEGIATTGLAPLLALLLNSGNSHPILAMLSLPVLLLLLAGRLVFSLRTYLEDRTGGNPNLLNRLDWARSMKLHNYLLIIPYLLIGIFGFVGLSWNLTWPMLITFPIAMMEFVQIQNILDGGRPNWRILELSAGGLIGLIYYLQVFTLWTH